MNFKNIITAYCPGFLHPLFDRIVNSPIGFRLAKGMFWSMAGAVISRGLMLVASIVVARLLGKTGFGELGMIQTTVGMFGVFAGFGLGLTATKHVAEFRQSDPARAGRIISLSGLFAMATGGLIALGLFIFAPWLAAHTINAPHLTDALKIGALILFISALNGAQTGALAGFEAFRTIAYINLFVGLISFPILILGTYFGGLTGAVWALAINLGVNWLLNHLALRQVAKSQSVPFSFQQCTREWPVLWKFSLPAALSSAMVGPVTWVCAAMLVNQPNGYGEMGIFAAALIFQNVMLFIGGMFDTVLLPVISNLKPNGHARLGSFNIMSTWILGIMAAIPLLCFPEVINVLFGPAYDGRSLSLTFSLVLFYTAIMMYKAGLARVLAANNLLWWGFFSNLLWAIILLGAAVFFVRWGASGLAASFALAYILNTIILIPLYYFRKLVPKGTLISMKSLLIWIVLIFLVFLNFLEAPLILRGIIFMPCLIVTGYAFSKLINPIMKTGEWSTNG